MAAQPAALLASVRRLPFLVLTSSAKAVFPLQKFMLISATPLYALASHPAAALFGLPSRAPIDRFSAGARMRGIFHLRHLRTAAGFLLTVLLCLLVVAPSASFVVAQDKPERRTIPVSVVDKDGKFVEGLTAENFRGEFRGKELSIHSVEPQRESRRIILVIGFSTSPGGSWELTWMAGMHAVITLNVQHAMALYTIKGGMHAETNFIQNPDELGKKIIQAEQRRRSRMEGRPASGKRPENAELGLRDGIIDIVKNQAATLQFGDVLYIVGHIEDSRSEANLDQVKHVLLQSGLRVFAVWPTEQVSGYYTNYFNGGRKFGRDLAEATGGLWVQLKPSRIKKEEIGKKVQPLYEVLTQFYTVEVEFPREIDKPRKWKLEVVDERGKKIKGLKVIYPRLLVPLETPAGK